MGSPLQSGTKLDHYEIISQLGAGGMGEVYLAEDTRLHPKVALQILPVEVASHHDRMRRFIIANRRNQQSAFSSQQVGVQQD